ncbi:MAG: glycerophosphodiester phosphodiesterase [Anaerolineae bacterium]|jgi:glycerophosphoryl diester phosphodiesterase
MRSKWLGLLAGLILVLVAGFVAASLWAKPARQHPFFAQFEHNPLVMAHQGGNGLWPDNTLYAFERAAALGVDVLEMDIHSTADGVLVVMHDSTVDRTTDGHGAIQDMTLAEFQALDAAYHWTADEGQSYPYRGQGIAAPALAEVFAAYPEMAMNIEIKQAEPSIAAPLCQLIRDYGLENQVLIASFHQKAIEEFRQACPEVATAAGQNEVIALFALSKVFVESAYSPAAQALQVPEYRSGLHVITPRFVEAAHRRKLQVHAWTINEVGDMQRMLDLGVDGIITDYPDQLLELLGR